MNLTPERLERLERMAQAQTDAPFGTLIALTPGELLELLRSYRNQVASNAEEEIAA